MFLFRNILMIILSNNLLFRYRAAMKKNPLKSINFIWLLFESALGLVTYDDSDGSHSDDDSGGDSSRQKNNSDDDSESELKVN